MKDTLSPTIEELLAHTDWMKALALRLLGEPAAAEDLVQDTWVSALGRPPKRWSNPRGWLARVLRNGARARHRGETHRQEREAAQAERIGLRTVIPTPEEVEERAELRRIVLEEVLALEEPYRTTILLRFFEELGPTEIAKRDELNVRTVESRLARGLEQLRTALDRRFGGDRRLWAMQLAMAVGLDAPEVALAFPSSLATTVVPGALPILVVMGIAAISILGWKRWDRGAAETASSSLEPESELTQPQNVERTATRASLQTPTKVPERVATEADNRKASTVPAVEFEALVLGAVFDPFGEPVGGVQLSWSAGEKTREAVADELGRFVLAVPPDHSVLKVFKLGWTPLLTPALDPESPVDEIHVVIAEQREVAGRVVDPEGEPVPNVPVRALVDASWRRHLPFVLDSTEHRRWRATTDDEGRFRWLDAPDLPGFSLHVSENEPFGSISFHPPRGPQTEIELVLPRPEPGPYAIRGMVRDAEGQGISEPWLSFAGDVERGTSDGFFEQRQAKDQPPAWIVACGQGWQPVRVERPKAGWPDFLELVLSEPALSLHGRLLDGAGNPLQGGYVYVTNTSAVGTWNGSERSLESLVAERDLFSARTDEWGGFRFPGLFDREYELSALDGETLERVHKLVRAGSGSVELRLPADVLVDLRGRLVGEDGMGIAGARIAAQIEAYRVPHLEGSRTATADPTDSDGRFGFTRLSPEIETLSWTGPTILPGSAKLEAGWETRPLVLNALRRCHLKLERVSEPSATHFEVWTEAGQRLPLYTFQKIARLEREGCRIEQRGDLVSGSSPTYAVAETARMLVLFAGESELKRAAFQPVPGELSILGM